MLGRRWSEGWKWREMVVTDEGKGGGGGGVKTWAWVFQVLDAV